MPENLISVDPDVRRAARYYQQFLDLRTQEFTQRRGWSVYLQKSRLDFDEYDQPGTVYVGAFRGDRLVAGARLLPTTRGQDGDVTGGFTYMIKDAQRGILRNLPTNLIDHPAPADPDVWELTRLVQAPGEPTAGMQVLESANKYLAGLDVKRILFLSAPSFQRLARRMGYTAEPYGPVFGEPKERCQVFNCLVKA
jgi:N-acyl-L-homoserine lactone synthetase